MKQRGNPKIAEAGQATQFPPGVSGNPAGKPKGTRSLSTIIRDLLEGEQDFNWALLPDNSNDLKKKYESVVPFEAIVFVASGQAMRGDQAAREWLRKAGYGDKLDINPVLPPGAVSILNAKELRITVVGADISPQADTQPDAKP